ncbi:aldose epimerase [Robbsia andropogonis]|uniref:aldose epimerase family protein n=1 Tax=Robbsia andropogonis TaxID=28092 RepID=UPI003D1EA283
MTDRPLDPAVNAVDTSTTASTPPSALSSSSPWLGASGVVTIQDAHGVAVFAPGAGGRLMRWAVDGQELLYWPSGVSPEELSDPAKVAKLRGGNPLPFPFIGRHRVGDHANQWRDPNDGVVRDLPQHGFARHTPFTHRVDDDGKGITMTLTPSMLSAADRQGYPYDFVFTARYRLDGETLDVTLTTHNSGLVPLPYYAGHHFYFALPHEMRGESTLTLPTHDRARQAADGGITPLPDDTNTVDRQAAMMCYTPGDPAIQDVFHLLGDTARTRTAARLAMPTLRRAIVLDLDTVPRTETAPWYAITTWTESDQSDFYCVEPWLGLPNAIHHGAGLRQLAPGAHEVAHCRLQVTPL